MIEKSTLQGRRCSSVTTSSSTAILASPIPIFIIGPMIKKMKEENEKKRMPKSANRDEAVEEAPGLRVGRDVWKWPPFWPYDDGFFLSQYDIDGKKKQEQKQKSSNPELNDMVSMLSGVAAVPKAALEGGDDIEMNKFNAIEYWNNNNDGLIPTKLDIDSIEKLKSHYEFYLPKGPSILEFGAAENSYLPDTIQPSRHVGVSASGKLMKLNPSLTDTLLIDLNKVNIGRDVDSDSLKKYASSSEQFDVIIMSNTVDYLSYPREVFRTAWYLLKPGGIMIVSFVGKDVMSKQYEAAQTKIWRDYNDDQHLWITGSFFQFSAGDGWENLLGFDISPESAKQQSDLPILNVLPTLSGKNNQIFVVQATKGFQYQTIDTTSLEESISSLCWMLPVLEERDKLLVIPRLARIYGTCDNDDVKLAIERNIPLLPSIYEALVKMDTFAFTFTMQAQVAADLISNVNFNGNNEQMIALKQGLGLRTPSNEFWVPIGQNTGAMPIDDKISLLATIVPKFGSNNQQQDIALQAFVDGLIPTYNMIRAKFPNLIESDIQLLGTELLAIEILQLNHSTPKEFALWIDCMSNIELLDILNQRKNLRTIALEDYDEYRIQKAKQQAKLEEYKRKYDEQVQIARQTRSLVFNARSQKMEIFINPLQKENQGNFITKLFQRN